MSTILDALKKSEQERKLNNIPTLSDLPTPDEGASFSRGWMLAFLVLIFLALILVALSLGYPWLDKGVTEKSPTIVLDNETVQAAISNETSDDVVVNVVSFSVQPDQRFVIINGKLVREGEFVRPGLKVIEIKSESVVLNHRGKRLEQSP
jgi:hypothetical protein